VAYDDPDQAELHIEKAWEDLPDQARANMKMYDDSELYEAKDKDKEEEKEEDEDIEIEGEDDIELDVEPSTDPKSEVQSNLQSALNAAKQLGDEKLVDQIGNTITFFTRVHIVGGEESEVLDDVGFGDEEELMEIRRLQKIAGIIK